MPPNNHTNRCSSPSRSFLKIPFFHNKRSRLDQHEMETSAKSAAVSKSFSIKSLLGLNNKPSKKEAVASHPNINEAATPSSAKDQQSTQTVPHKSRREALNKSRKKSSSSPSDHSILSDKKSKSKNRKSKKYGLKRSRIPKPRPTRSRSSESSSSWSDSSSTTKSICSHFNSLKLKTDSDSESKPTEKVQQEQNVVNAEQSNACEQEAQIEKSECSPIILEEASSALHPGLLDLLMNSLIFQSIAQSLGQQTVPSGVKLPPGLNRTGRQIVVTGSVGGQVLVQNVYNSQESMASSRFSSLSNSSFGILNFMDGNNGNDYNNFFNYNKMPPNAANSNDNQHSYYANQYPQYNFQQANPFMNQFQNPQGQFPHFNQWTPTNNISLTSVSSSSRSLYGNSRQNISSTSHLVPTTQNYPGQMQQMPYQMSQMSQDPVFVHQQPPQINFNYNFASAQAPMASGSVHNNDYAQNQQPLQHNFNPPSHNIMMLDCQPSTSRVIVPSNVLPPCEPSTSRAIVPSNVLPPCEPSTSRAIVSNNRQATKKDPVKEYLQCEWILNNGQICPEKFENNSNVYKDPLKELANHIKEHINEEKKNKTNMCRWNGCERTESFGANYQLDLHLRGHSKYQEFECEVPACRKKYRRVADLKVHIRTHPLEDRKHITKYAEEVGTKPYECNQIDKNGKICKKAFTNRSDRAKHVKTHSGETPFRCPVKVDGADSGKVYTDLSSLRKHVKTKHGPLTWKRALKNKQLIDRMNNQKKDGEEKYDFGKIYQCTQENLPDWSKLIQGLPISSELNPSNSTAVADSSNLDRLTMECLQTLLNQTKQVDFRLLEVITDLTNARDYPNELYGVWEEQGGLYSVVPIDTLTNLLREFKSITPAQATVNALPPQQPSNNDFVPNDHSNSDIQFNSSYQLNGQASQDSTSHSSSEFDSNSSTLPSNHSNTYNNNNDNSGFQ